MIRVADSLFSGWFCGRTLHAPTIWPRLRRPFFDPLPQAPYRHQGSVRSPLVGKGKKYNKKKIILVSGGLSIYSINA